MKKSPLMSGIALLALGFFISAVAGAQSLGDAARKARAEKQKAPKATRVFTEDNLPKQGGLSTTSLPELPESVKGKEAGAKGAEGKEEKKDKAEEEKEWRAKFAKLYDDLKYEEKKLDVLQRELNLSQMQNYSDPNVALREQYQRTEITKRTQEIDSQKLAVEKAKKAIADLQDELRRKSLPARWGEPQ